MSEPVIKVSGLTKVYPGGVLAVDHISFEVYEGEIFALLGPNGAGKSTTIGMLTTSLRPTEGEAIIAGYSINSEPSKVRSAIGVVPQEFSADEDLTGWENITLIGYLYGLPKDTVKQRAAELLQTVGLYNVKDKKVETYSGGMRRRLEISMGLVNRPHVLFLDEPTLGLDVQTRAAIWEYILKLKKDYNMTIFLTTHYLEEADAYGDRVAIIDRGRILVTGKPDELKRSVTWDTLFIEVSGSYDSAKQALATLPQVKDVSFVDGQIVIKVADGPTAIPVVVSAINSLGQEVKRLSLNRPSLDEVYMYYTGKSLREESMSKDEVFALRRTLRRARS
ncbi:MAG: ATP-binding cassette domain-containing protein [Nitrososphaeria archaeon]|jgi:ABC-2 type transport system ATP-binding protein